MTRQNRSQPLSPEKQMVEEYMDCAGNTRTFELNLYGEKRFLEAVEVVNGERAGLRFVLLVKTGEVPPWGEIRNRIRDRLAKKHIVRNEKGALHMLHNVVRAQITDRDLVHNDRTPSLIVDDLVLTWEELGALLMTYSGFGLRLEICETGEE